MKKTLTVVFAALCVLALFTGCAGGYAGMWRCAYMDTGRDVMTAGDLAAVGSELYIDLRSGGSGTMTADGETQRITWKLSGDRSAVLLTVNGEIEPFRIEGDGLVWTMDGVTVTFLREKSDAYREALATLSYQQLGE